MGKYNFKFKPDTGNLYLFFKDIIDISLDGLACIPPNQRPYSWDPNDLGLDLLIDLIEFKDVNLKNLNKDVKSLTKELKNSPTLDTYFFGNVVVCKIDGSERTDIVDGQQRLTSSLILLSVIRDIANLCHYKKKDEHKLTKKADEIQARYIGELEGSGYRYFFEPADDYQNRKKFH